MPLAADLIRLTATEAVRLLRRGEISPLDLIAKSNVPEFAGANTFNPVSITTNSWAVCWRCSESQDGIWLPHVFRKAATPKD